jgi:hypothetical protein
MAKFDADRLRESLERLNRGQLAKLERLAEDLLREAEGARLAPKRAGEDERAARARSTRETGRRRLGGKP